MMAKRSVPSGTVKTRIREYLLLFDFCDRCGARLWRRYVYTRGQPPRTTTYCDICNPGGS